MLLGYNTNGLQNHRLDEALQLLADHGYQAVALTLDVPHLDPFNSSPREVSRIATLLDRLGLQPTIETGARFVLDPQRKHEPTLMTRDAEGRERRLDFYRRCARMGQDLDARVLSFWSGADHSPGSDSRDWLYEGVVRACEAIRSQGIEPAFEPEPGMAVETVADWAAMAAALGDASPSLCLDIGHLYVTGEGPTDEIVSAHADRIRQVHLEDIKAGIHEHLLPGQGDMDFYGVRKALENAAYQGPVCFELSRSSHMAPQAVALCRETWEASGH